MAYNNQTLLTDKNGNPIPQWYDPSADEFKPFGDPDKASKDILSKLDEGISTQLKGSLIEEIKVSGVSVMPGVQRTVYADGSFGEKYIEVTDEIRITNGIKSDFESSIYQKTSTGGTIKSTRESTTNGSVIFLEKIDILTTRVQFRVFNQGDEEIIIDGAIYGKTRVSKVKPNSGGSN